MSEGGSPIETWEFELAPPDESSAAAADVSGPSPKVAFGSLLGAPSALPLDGDGNGGGKITVDPGPHSSVVFTLAATPKAGGADVTATASAKVTNFLAKLMMADGSPAPAGKKITLELNVSAGPDAPAPEDGPKAA